MQNKSQHLKGLGLLGFFCTYANEGMVSEELQMGYAHESMTSEHQEIFVHLSDEAEPSLH